MKDQKTGLLCDSDRESLQDSGRRENYYCVLKQGNSVTFFSALRNHSCIPGALFGGTDWASLNWALEGWKDDFGCYAVGNEKLPKGLNREGPEPLCFLNLIMKQEQVVESWEDQLGTLLQILVEIYFVFILELETD